MVACWRKKCSIDLCLTQRENRGREGETEKKKTERATEGRAKTTTVKSRVGLKKSGFRRKWETKARTCSPHGRFKEPPHLRALKY